MSKQGDGGGYYISLCRAYWQRAMEFMPEPTDTHLYFYLVEYCNKKFWESPFRLSNGALCSALGITTKTLIKARGRLVQMGLIEFIPGHNNRRESTQYNLLLWWKNSTTLGTTSGTTLGTTSGTTHIYKRQKTKNKTLICEPSIFENGELLDTPGVKALSGFNPPTMEDVISYALNSGETEEEACKFFNFFNSQGWKKKGGVQITNWESAFNYWASNKSNFDTKSSSADNIRASQEYIIREMQRSAAESNKEYYEELPDI